MSAHLESKKGINLAAGALVAASTDLTFNFYGYVSVGLNDFLTALYLVMVKRSPATQGLTTTGILFYNAALSMPALMLALAISKEPLNLLLFPDLYSKSFRVRSLSPTSGTLCLPSCSGTCRKIQQPCTTEKLLIITGL